MICFIFTCNAKDEMNKCIKYIVDWQWRNDCIHYFHQLIVKFTIAEGAIMSYASIAYICSITWTYQPMAIGKLTKIGHSIVLLICAQFFKMYINLQSI